VQSGPMPAPAADELLVKVVASGVNFIDVYRREGTYPMATPLALGHECAGRVVAVGDGITNVIVGDVIATESGRATHAEYAIVPVERAVPVPDGLDPQLAAAAMVQGITAHFLVTSTHKVTAADQVLIHAAAGGVGQLLVQLAKARGAFVVATVGSAAKVAVAKELGADAVIRSDETDDLAAAVREASDGGVHVAYDGVGKATFEASLTSLRPRGLMVLFGAASGQVPPFDLQRLNPLGSLFVTRPTIAHYVAERDELLWRTREVLGAVADGSLRVSIGGRYGLEDAADAYRDLEARRTTGKLLIVP